MSFKLGELIDRPPGVPRCWVKHVHASEGAAWAHIRAKYRRGERMAEGHAMTDGALLSPYECKFHNGWHIGRAKKEET